MEEKRIWRLEHAYRTELCRFLQREGYCPFGKECRFGEFFDALLINIVPSPFIAHDEHELRLRRVRFYVLTTM